MEGPPPLVAPVRPLAADADAAGCLLRPIVSKRAFSGRSQMIQLQKVEGVPNGNCAWRNLNQPCMQT